MCFNSFYFASTLVKTRQDIHLLLPMFKASEDALLQYIKGTLEVPWTNWTTCICKLAVLSACGVLAMLIKLCIKCWRLLHYQYSTAWVRFSTMTHRNIHKWKMVLFCLTCFLFFFNDNSLFNLTLFFSFLYFFSTLSLSLPKSSTLFLFNWITQGLLKGMEILNFDTLAPLTANLIKFWKKYC